MKGTILALIDRAMHDVNAEPSLASDVIPVYEAVSHAVYGVTDKGRVQTMKTKLLKDIDSHLADVMKQPLYSARSAVS